MNLKWSYFSSKGHYISYKVTIVLKKNSLTPALILTHNRASHDTQKKNIQKITENSKTI